MFVIQTPASTVARAKWSLVENLNASVWNPTVAKGVRKVRKSTERFDGWKVFLLWWIWCISSQKPLRECQVWLRRLRGQPEKTSLLWVQVQTPLSRTQLHDMWVSSNRHQFVVDLHLYLEDIREEKHVTILCQCQRRPASPILAKTGPPASEGTAVSNALVLTGTLGSSVRLVSHHSHTDHVHQSLQMLE